MSLPHRSKDDTHLLKNFHVIIPISNPVRYKSRYKLLEEKVARLKLRHPEIKVWIVELSFGDRSHKITDNDPYHIQLETYEELWHKENLINVGISRLPPDWEYVAWVDGDIEFVRPDWALETAHQLQHHMVVQMFQTAIDLGPTGEAFNTYRGFAWSHITRQPYPKPHNYYPYWHSGFAWAARREAIDHLGGLIDFAVLGSADHHMAMALIGKAQDSVPKDVNPSYTNLLMNWQDRAEKHIKRDIGFVPGTILHHWHGKKKDRKYWDRWQILIKNSFDPHLDLKKDWQGVYQLTDRSIQLRDDIRAYMRARNEDSVDFE